MYMYMTVQTLILIGYSHDREIHVHRKVAMVFFTILPVNESLKVAEK